MGKAFFQLLDYVNPALSSDPFYGSLEGDLKVDEDGKWDFGLAVHGTGKVFIDNELVVDNSTDQQPGKSFFSLGSTEKIETIVLKAGRTYQLRLEFGCASTSPLANAANGSVTFAGGGARLGACPRISVKDSNERAVQAAKDSGYAVICTGQVDCRFGNIGEWETEGHDRTNTNLPPYVDELISQVAAACPRTVVVNRTGMPVSMPWASEVPVILQAWYGGNETGNAIADVLFGDFNPCGKMPISWPKRLMDNPADLNFGSTNGRVLFGEDIFVGYRWYEKMEIEPLWRFGHGLSYTRFAIYNPRISLKMIQHGKIEASVSVEMENVGSIPGSEVLQLYVSPPDSSIIRPQQELHGFQKVHLKPGEKGAVKTDADKYALCYWDESEERWCTEKGTYEVTVFGGACNLTQGSPINCSIQIEETSWWSGI